jgi:hypothetical protein
VFREANKTPERLGCADDGFGFTPRVVGIVLDFIPESIYGDHANVGTLSGEACNGSFIVEAGQRESGEDKDNMFKSKEPHSTRGTGGIEYAMHGMFDLLPTLFTWVLMLIFGLGLPVINVIGTKDILHDTFADDF